MPTCWGKLLMEGEGEVRGDTGMEIGSKKKKQERECTFHSSHMRWTDWLHRSTEVGYSSCFMLKKNQPFLSSFCLCHLPDGPASLLLPPGYEKAVQTQPVSPGLPRERYPTFTPLFFFSFFSSLWLFFIYLQLDACSSIDYFTKDMSGLCLGRAGLYI